MKTISLVDALRTLKNQGYLRVHSTLESCSIDEAIKQASEDELPTYRVDGNYIFDDSNCTSNQPVYIATRSGSLSDCVRVISKLGADTIITNAGEVDICDYLADTITAERDEDGFADRRFRIEVDTQQIFDLATGSFYVAYTGERLKARKQRIAAASVKTERKAASSAENGKKGGRPKTDHYYVIISTSTASASGPRYSLNFLSEADIIRIAEDDLIRCGTSLYDVAEIEQVETPDGDFIPVRDWKPGEQLQAALDALRQDSCIWEIYPHTVRGVREFRKAAKQISETLYTKALELSK